MGKLVCIGGGEIPRIKNGIQLPYETKEIKELSLSEDLQYYTNSSTTTKSIVEKLDNDKIYDDLFEVLNK